MADIEWAEPPPPKTGLNQGTIFTPEVVAQLRANPGRWALLKRDHRNAAVASAYRKRHPEFETKMRGSEGHFDIYARYVGDGQGPS